MEIPYGDLKKAPIIRILSPWVNFTRASPVLWIVIVSFLMLIFGLNVPFLRFFAWFGGFLTAFFIALGLSIFRSL